MLIPEHYRNLSDLELISEFKKSGNKIVIGVIYNRYSHLVFGLCMRYLKEEEEAEDMVVHIFTKLMADLIRHDIEYFKSWLYTYTKNSCLMHLRTVQSLRKKEKDYKENVVTLMENEEDPHQKAKIKEIQLTYLEEAINELNIEQQKCIRLFYLREMSYQDIAKETGYSINNVKSYIQNGKRNLKIKLDAMGYNNLMGLALLLITIID